MMPIMVIRMIIVIEIRCKEISVINFKIKNAGDDNNVISCSFTGTC